MLWICGSLPYRQKAEELTLQLQSRNEDCEMMTAKLAELQTALRGHQEVCQTTSYEQFRQHLKTHLSRA